VLQDRLKAAVGAGTDLKPARAGCLEALAAVAAHQAQEAKASPEALLGVRPALQDQRGQRRGGTFL